MNDQAEMVEDDAWYAWGENGPEPGWLLSYVDVLCVILAMVLVLLVTELRTQPPPATEASAPPPSENTVEPVPVPAGHEIPDLALFAPLSASLPPPPATAILRPVTEMPVPREPALPEEAAPDHSVEMLDRPSDDVKILRDEQGMTMQIAEAVLFDSARAELRNTAGPVLERTVLLLGEFAEVDVAVQGHTDDRPIQGGPYSSNWALGAARANAVAGFLLEQGFPPERLRLESYADTRPITDNTTPEGRARNRRVEIRVDLAPLAAAGTASDQRSES